MKKTMQWIATAALVAAGIALLEHPAHAQAPAAPTRFTVTDAGTAGKPDVILIPGLASSKAVWDGEVKLLGPTYRLHVLQVAGFAGAPVAGNATMPMLPGILAELHAYITAQKMHPVVIGHSLGGLIGIMLANEHPEDVTKLVIVDSLPFYSVLFMPTATVEMVTPIAQGMKAQIIGATPEQFAALAQQTAASMVNNPDAQKHVAAGSVASDRTVMANAMVEDMTTDMRSAVATIKTPTLMLYPYDAKAVPDSTKVDSIYQTAYKPMPNVKIVRIDDSRHFIMYDQPAKLNDAIVAFLK